MLSKLGIGHKLLLLVLPFGGAACVLGLTLSLQRYEVFTEMRSAQELVAVATQSANLIDGLQTERGLSNGYLSGQGPLPDKLKEARQKTDQSLSSLAGVVSTLSAGELAGSSQRVVTDVQNLLAKRGAVDSRGLPATEAFAAYSQQIDAQVALLASLGRATDAGDVIRYSTSLSNLLCVKEYAGRERGFVNGLLSGGPVSLVGLAQATALQARQDMCASQLLLLSPAHVREAMQPYLQSDADAALETLRQTLHATAPGTAASIDPELWFTAATAQIVQLKKAQDDLLLRLSNTVEQHQDDASRSLILTLACSVVLLVLLIFGGGAVYRSIRYPIVRLSGLMQEMSHNLDLAVRAKLEGSDEIAGMGQAFDRLVSAFGETLKDVKLNAHQLVKASDALQAVSARAANAAEAQSTSSSGIAAAVEQMTVGIASVSDNTRDNLQVVQQMQEGVNVGRHRMQATAAAMTQTASSVEGAGQVIQDLAEKSQNIRRIITAIREIADQTNLLALNAAIEAARAGEMGRGFAVVADEVRKLAERTGKETVEIASLIETMTASTNDASSRMQQAHSQMSEGLQLVQSSLDELGRIHQEADLSASKSQDTAAAMQQQSAASNEVAVNVSRIASLAEDNAAIVDEAAQLASQLKQTASTLVGYVDRFKHTSS
ncbi:methyl-accepting chemotaxis protein [Vogesella sp. XCS3]|uniref:methyl-accepting chemotaxis protein n=1 Tax=Vogesella sp. XCS3 TaxID=2877939 RepID=UPI001D0B4F4E|nr:methyl-accepting chemotaxis protein [Vogesella sp. XCS3]UDM16775.1 methyl-accepting chemotaxis protein [Vogesella sp. XCS3]